MVAAAEIGGLDGARVLEIGGGVGAVQVELLAAGADRGEVVELVRAYEPFARDLAEERGLADRTSFHVVDLLDEPQAVQPADIVVLNRVVCCSADGVELTAIAARLTRRVLVLSYPRDVWWTRTAVALLNAGQRLLRRRFRVFVHAPAALSGSAVAEGLAPEGATRGARAWEVAVFRRTA
jgi:magnesium-protoporphyrin O-methyltransferase